MANKSKPAKSDDVKWFRKSYDKVPQPEGEFKNLFQEMQDRNAAKRRRSTERKNPTE